MVRTVCHLTGDKRGRPAGSEGVSLLGPIPTGGDGIVAYGPATGDGGVVSPVRNAATGKKRAGPCDPAPNQQLNPKLS